METGLPTVVEAGQEPAILKGTAAGAILMEQTPVVSAFIPLTT
jgi:hypothetical protein